MVGRYLMLAHTSLAADPGFDGESVARRALRDVHPARSRARPSRSRRHGGLDGALNRA